MSATRTLVLHPRPAEFMMHSGEQTWALSNASGVARALLNILELLTPQGRELRWEQVEKLRLQRRAILLYRYSGDILPVSRVFFSSGNDNMRRESCQGWLSSRLQEHTPDEGQRLVISDRF